ncbi:hypothetical protein [Neobacillus cucumis]|uniref:hypothetical protein n=1 Tax=Neobacillus cucumis TaxID=1740721 RepID=UPI001962F836|nr:hypothetical protein [Neobacillus cucumis]MBM7650905.1 hypothetical protein [Neobacillus cucumis]
MNQSIALLGKITSILAGILLIIAHTLNLLAGHFGSTSGSLLTFLAHLILIFVFFCLYIYQGETSGVIGFLAMLLGNIGNIIVTAIVYVEMAEASTEKASFVFTTAVNEPIHTFGPLLFVIGMILLAVSIIRVKVLPTFSGYLLLIGTIVFAAASVAGDYQTIIEVMGAVFTGTGLIVAGIKVKS